VHITRKKRRWIVGISAAVIITFVALAIAASMLSKRFEPFIREQALQYMRDRFDADVELAALRIRMPKASPLNVLLNRGRGSSARVEADGISMRYRGVPDLPPLFKLTKVTFDVDLGTLFEESKVVKLVTIHGMEINVPPKGQRRSIAKADSASPSPSEEKKSPSVIIKEVRIDDANLTILPKDPSKNPLHFDIHRLKFESAGANSRGMKYDASLTNAKPPGEIKSRGTFGPWAKDEPGDTPIAGDYTFDNADLGVFSGIAGILKSTGSFDGTLSSINARGQADVPDFRLKMSNNRVPLTTTFEVLVDGTNGNTVLQPVKARLGSTNLTTSGAVLKQEGQTRRTITLDVNMPNGDLRDVLRLAMKGAPFMEGRLNLKTKVAIPPLSGKVREKIMLDGRFQVSNAKFLKSKIQDQIDTLSRRGQGQPSSGEIDEVVSGMKGVFLLENELLTFQSLTFGVPGAEVDLAGTYNLDADVLDFLGNLKLVAKVSETMTGWKRWALKPVDPFFAKEGAGTFLRIAVTGTSRQPHFGAARGRQKEKEKQAGEAQRRTQ
jgi:hypothetical protein